MTAIPGFLSAATVKPPDFFPALGMAGVPFCYFFVCPRAKMLATKLSTSVEQMSQYP